MKINFQYFAVKYIACSVGYTETEAQLVASMCQFISDNYEDAALYTPFENLSEGIIENHLYSGGGDKCKVSLLLTALENYDDVALLNDKKIQEDRFIPFDYFPAQQIVGNKDYSVKSIKALEDNDLFEGLFKDAKKLYHAYDEEGLDPNVLIPERKNALVRLGVLMHILVNTFVNEPFNGYLSNKNSVMLLEALDSLTYENITSSYKPEKYANYPYVGSFRLGGVQNDYNVQYYAQNMVDKRKKINCRNNPVFINAGQSVYGFLMLFKNKKPSQQEWENSVKPKLEMGLNSSYTSTEDLIKWWANTTPFKYYYDSMVCKSSLVKLDEALKPEEQGYFDFLLTLDHIRKSVIYNGGRKMKINESSTTKVSCDVEKANFDGTVFTVTTNISTSVKLDSISVELTVMDSVTGKELFTDIQKFKNTSKFKMLFTLPIPLDDHGYDMVFDFSWKEKGIVQEDTYAHTIQIKGNDTIIATKDLIHPCSTSGNEVVQVINGTDSAIGDYKYPLNDNYTNQQGVEQMDVFLPVEFQLQLAESYRIFKLINCNVAIKGSGAELAYCNNKKYIDIKVNKESGNLIACYTEEWKNHFQTKPFSSHRASLLFEIDVALEVISSDEEGYRHITLKNSQGEPMTKKIDFLWGY